MRKIFFLAFILIFVSSCATSIGGKSFDYSAVKTIEKGKSSKEDVRKALGEPLSVRNTESGEVWIYYESEVGTFFSSTHSLDVYFSNDGVVSDYKYRGEKKI